MYNTHDEVDRAVDAVAAIAAGRGTPGPRSRSWPAGRHRTRQHRIRPHGIRQPAPPAAEQAAPVPAASA